MPAYKHGRWDGYIRLYQNSYFPTGLLSRVVKALHSKAPEGVSMEINYPTYPIADLDVLDPTMFDGIVLRPYQLDAARLLLTQGRGIAKMATNAGKTASIAAICKAINGNVLVVVTSRDLLYQTADRLSGFLGEEAGKVGDSLYRTERVTVGIINSLYNVLTGDGSCYLKGPFDCVIYDECHHISSKTSQDVMMGIPAPYRFGFSGTPLKHADLADLVLIGATGEVIIEVTNEELVTSGISAKPIVEMIEYDVKYSDEDWQEDWQSAYDRHIVRNNIRNAHIIDDVNSLHKTTLILVDRIEHGQLLSDNIPDSIFVHGGSSAISRAHAISKLRNTPGSIVVATNIFGEGVDVPAVELLVLAGGGKGYVKLLQQVGRGMRAKAGDNVLYVKDFIDLSNRYLAEHSALRAELYQQEGFEVKII